MAAKTPAPLPERDQLALDGELRKLIRQYGAAHVRKAATRLCRSKAGRKLHPDWQHLRDEIRQDAIDWLDGKDPRALRSDYSVAKAFSKQHPGHDGVSTYKRILRKLKKQRAWNYLVTAWELSMSERPYAEHFRVVPLLADQLPIMRDSILQMAEWNRDDLERYRQRLGEPAPELTIEAIGDQVRNQPVLPQSEFVRRYGMIGGLRRPRT